MHIENVAKDEFRVCYTLDNGNMVSISISPEGIILDLYDEPGDPKSLGFTPNELEDFLNEQGVK
jgi:hypothetical protein